MQGSKKLALRLIRHTPQGDANAANAAGGIFMVAQRCAAIFLFVLTLLLSLKNYSQIIGLPCRPKKIYQNSKFI